MKYTEEMKFELVKRYYDGGSVAAICAEQGIPSSTFYSWIKQYKVTYTYSGVCLNGAEFVKMKNKVERLEKKY